MISPLVKAIQAANPRIMDLKFGCKVVVQEADYSPTERSVRKYKAHRPDTWKWVWTIKNEREKIIRIDEADWVVMKGKAPWPILKYVYGVSVDEDYVYYAVKEILGREIRLADVLLAIKKKNVNWRGEFEVLLRDEQYEWDLSHDSLDAQSPECIKFLTELLV